MSCRLTGSSSTTIMFSGIQAGLSSLAYRGGMLKKEYSTAGCLSAEHAQGHAQSVKDQWDRGGSWLKGRARGGEVQVHGAGLQRNFTSRTFQLTTKMRRLLLLASAGNTKK